MGQKFATFGTRALLYLTVAMLLTSVIPPARMPVVAAATFPRASHASLLPPAAEASASAAVPKVAIESNPAPVPQFLPNRLQARLAAPAAIPADDPVLPIAFMPNVGQIDPQVRFHARGAGGSVFFTPQGIIFTVGARADQRRFAPGTNPISATRAISVNVTRLRFDGTTAVPTITAEQPLAGSVHFFLGPDARTWRTDVPTYAAVHYGNLYPGIDLRYDGHTGRLKGTYQVAVGSNPGQIRWRYDGATSVQTHTDGNLLVVLPGPSATQPITLTEQAPIAWQDTPSGQIAVPVRYAVGADSSISFVLPNGYDLRFPLTIDPTLAYSTYLGGDLGEAGNKIAVDSAGNSYTVGYTRSTNFPIVNPAQGGYGGGICSSEPCYDAFVTKLNATGTAVIYSTFLGGNNDDFAADIAIDRDGSAYVVGSTLSANFPTKNAYDATYGGCCVEDVFVTKLNPAGNRLLYSTFLGGAAYDRGTGIAVDKNRQAYIVGYTASANPSPFPTTPGVIKTTIGSTTLNTFVTKLSATGTTLSYSTYLGGTDDDQAYGIAVDAAGNAYVAGKACSSDFPTQNPSQTYGGACDGFVTKLNSTASALLFSTFIGGNDEDIASELVLDPSGNSYIVGTTNSSNFPTTTPFQAQRGGGTCSQPLPDSCDDAFITKLNANGNMRLYSTYLGGSDIEQGLDITVNTAREVIVTGVTYSSNFPVQNPLQASGSGVEDAFISHLSASGTALLFSTYLAGNSASQGYGIAVSAAGNVYVTGLTQCNGFPTQNPLFGCPGTGSQAYIAKLQYSSLAAAQMRGLEDCACHDPAPHLQTLNPVNTRTGNFWTSVTDLQVEQAGPPIAWTRHYASQAVTDTTGLSPGWQQPYAARLLLPSVTGDPVTVLSGHGNRLQFTDLGNNRDYQAAPGVYSTLVKGHGVYTQTLRTQARHVFDATSGKLVRVLDPQGRQITLRYNATLPTQLDAIVDAVNSSRALTLTWTSGRLSSVTDGTRTVLYGYDGTTGDLNQVTDVRGKTTTYTYYANHLLKQIKNHLLEVVEDVDYSAYTAQGRVVRQTLQDGRQLQFQYLSASTVITTTGSDGTTDRQTINYASTNAMTGSTINGQTVATTGFDDTLSPGRVTDGNNHTTQTTFSAVGLPQVTVDPLGGITQRFYDDNHNLVRVIDPLGIESHYRYDSFNNVISTTLGITTTSALRATTLYTYTTGASYGSRLEYMQAPDGVVTRYEYETAKPLRVKRMTLGSNTALALRTDYAYDSAGRLLDTKIYSGSTFIRTDRTEYNADNTVKRSARNFKDWLFAPERPDEDVVTNYGYDALGRQIWTRDLYGRYDVTHYDSKNRVDWTARNLSGYSGGTLPAQPPAYSPSLPEANIATFYGYDGLGRTTFVTETGILTGTFNLATRQFSSSTQRVTRTEYDLLSRPITVTLNYRPGQPATADTNVQLLSVYDGAGNLTAQRDGYGRWTRTEYDALSRPITVTVNLQDGNPLTGARDADLISVTRYDAGGRVIRQIDNWVNGSFTSTEPITDRITLFDYNALGQVITTTLSYDPSQTTRTDTNRRSVVAYDPLTTRQLGTRDPLGRWIALSYDLLGRVTAQTQNCRTSAGVATNQHCATYSTTQPDRNVRSQTRYDGQNRAFETVDPLGVVTRQGYDLVDRVRATTRNYLSGVAGDAATNVTTQVVFDGLGRTTVLTDALGLASRTGYNPLGQTVTMTDTLGRVTRMGYDGSGTLRWTQRYDGQVTVQQVDGLGRVTATIVNYQDGVVSGGEPSDRDLITQTSYDAAGRVIRQTDAVGRVVALAYDHHDRLLTVTENQVSGSCDPAPCNVQTQYQYDRAGNRTALIDPRSHIRRFTYDAADRLVEARDGLNRLTAWQYDAAGNRTLQDDPRGSGYDLTMQYDGLNRPTQTSAGSSANLATITNGYNGRGERTSLSDGTGSTSFAYDPLGRMTQLTAPATGMVEYKYNERGDRKQLTYPGSGAPVIDYIYFDDGRLRLVKQGSTTLATYAYDAAGRVTQVARLTGAPGITNYQYDGADRLRAVRTTSNGTPISTFSYLTGRLGNRASVAESLPTSPAPSSTRLKTATFEAASRVDPFTGVDGLAGTSVFDRQTPIKGGYSVRVPNVGSSYLQETFGDSSTLYVSFYLRIGAVPISNTRILRINGNGALAGNLALTTDRRLRLLNNATIIGSDSAQLTVGTVYRVGLRQTTGSGTAVLQAYVATGDAAFGSPFAQSSSQTIANAADEVLLGATFSTAVDMTVDDLTLDSGGMPPPSTDPPTRNVVYGYDALTRLSSAVETGSSTNSFSYGYDLAGNRNRVTTNGITVTSSYDAADQLTGGGVTYDAAGNQTSDGSTTATFDALGRLTQRGSTSFSYTGDGVLVAQTTSGATTRYTQDLAAPLPQILQYLASGVLTSYTYGVDRLGGVNATARGWQHLDALGSMRRSVDDAGSVTRTQNYDPWGTPQGGTLPGVFGFAGELQNASSGLLHLRARWYTTGQGRFASVDPFPGMPEQPYSQHPYAYALSNPVRWTDPSGKCVFTGIDTLLCAGVVLTIWEAIAIIVAAGVATYAIYDTCVTQGYCDQLAIDLEQALQLPNHTGSPPVSLPPSNPPGFPLPQEQPLEVNGFPLGNHENFCTPEGFSMFPPEVQQLLRTPNGYPLNSGLPPTIVFAARDFVSVRGPTAHDRSDIDNEGPNQKGRWAESQFREYLTKQASPPWAFIGNHTHAGGIDGVFQREVNGAPEYLVAEIKYYGRYPPSFNAKQLAPDNIEKLLSDSVGSRSKDLIKSGYRRVRARVYTDGSIDVRELLPVPGRLP